jgi:SPP1 gp7 family putative phage head morphogenesis protein
VKRFSGELLKSFEPIINLFDVLTTGSSEVAELEGMRFDASDDFEGLPAEALKDAMFVLRGRRDVLLSRLSMSTDQLVRRKITNTLKALDADIISIAQAIRRYHPDAWAALFGEGARTAEALNGLVQKASVTQVGVKLGAWFKARDVSNQVQKLAERMFDEIDGYQSRDFDKWIADMQKRDLGLDVRTPKALAQVRQLELKREAVIEQVRLVNKLQTEMSDDLIDELVDAVAEGARADRIRDIVAKRISTTDSRLKLIARDQVGKVHSAMQKQKQEALGVQYYMWRSSEDERVRDLHDELNGQVFSWSSGHPTEGHPGEPINCRCIPIPMPDYDPNA